MNKIFSAISYGLLFTSISFAQNGDENSSKKKSAINYLRDKSLKTTSYEMLEYDDKGLELSKIKGISADTWHITIEENEIILQLKHKGELMDSYTIKDYNLSTDGVLYLSSAEDNLHFWFYDDYILLESRDDEMDVDELNPAHSLTWFFFS
tara:strand:- start:49 stop:501 length:453 start_codon:yes stop_codon:yes gene_type:complete